MQPLGLSDSQYDAVVSACAPLAPADRGRFLVELAALLRNEPVIGDGTVDRAIRALQRQYFRPPAVAANREAVHRPVRGSPIP
jgi:hypothetical protein